MSELSFRERLEEARNRCSCRACLVNQDVCLDVATKVIEDAVLEERIRHHAPVDAVQKLISIASSTRKEEVKP